MKMKKTNYTACLIAAVILLLVVSVAAAEESHEDGAHAFHKHHAALIFGNTFDEHGENGLSIGLDYEYRFTSLLGLGGLAEYAGGDFKHVLLAVPLFIHPNEHWRFVAAAGAEVHEAHENHREREWIARAGVAYQFPLDSGYSISPEFNVDFSEHETLYVVGLSFGFGW